MKLQFHFIKQTLTVTTEVEDFTTDSINLTQELHVILSINKAQKVKFSIFD